MNKSLVSIFFASSIFLSGCSEYLNQGSLGFQYNNIDVQKMFDRMIPGSYDYLYIYANDVPERESKDKDGKLRILEIGMSTKSAPGLSICKKYKLTRLEDDAVEVGALCKDNAHTQGRWIDIYMFNKLATK